MLKPLFIFLIIPVFSSAAPLPEQSIVPGGIVNLAVASADSPQPQVLFQEKRVLVKNNGEQWLAIVGIPLSAKPGKHHVSVKIGAQKPLRYHFDVVDKEYPAQYITIKNKRMVNPNPDDLKRIKADRIPINKALRTWTEQEQVDMNFIAPVDGRLSSLFGLRRFFNNQPKNPHSGLDIAAPTGTAIMAPAGATVIDTGDYYYNGKSIFLDHGQGLISGYFHMSEIAVQPGQKVKQGEILGAVGATGRVTGPHLHWNVYLNRNKVDPALFISEFIPILDARNKK